MVGVEIKFPDISVPPETMVFVQRVLGPFAEVGDFLSDKIRFYRWRSSFKMMDRAAQIARERGIDPKEVPLKTFVPLLEKSSLEDESSPLIEKWANLLAEASREGSQSQPVYIDILASLGPIDVAVLEDLVRKNLYKVIIENLRQGGWDFSIPPSHVELGSTLSVMSSARRRGLFRVVVDGCKAIEINYTGRRILDEIFSLFQRTIDIDLDSLLVATLEYVADEELDGAVGTTFAQHSIIGQNPASFDVLVSRGLITRATIDANTLSGTVVMTAVSPTPLALGFVAACRGEDICRQGEGR